ncbi:uncharacterized protein LOC129756828 [Uranotaenia lowii]|uniref:uncharacterized protein LOC129756828 n=1 Tax=Uranotaenia lowii TaxID=190385 RepID=UPI002479F9F2|nr:uncharacterized protein LOC129756828 [Uranotaenia lowii]
MNENLTKICRICLTEGSRNIFQKTVAQDGLYNVSSLNRISEKLRYVTLLKIDELENLPALICDLCIVQLNVAYNFKRQATDSDTKLRQYMIENGIDIMKDPRSLPRSRPTAATTATTTIRAITSSARVNQRCNSTSSSSVQEVALAPNSYPGNGIRLQPIRIKVESPESLEQSPDSIELISNSTISPLSSTNSTSAVPNAVPVTEATTAAISDIANSSLSSSKNSLGSNGRDSTMVVVENRQSNDQADREYVRRILGSNSSLASSSEQVAKSDATDKGLNGRKSRTSSKILDMDKPEDSNKNVRMRNLLSSLTINMVTSRFPKSKLRIKARKKLQNKKLHEKNHGTPRSSAQSRVGGPKLTPGSVDKSDPRIQNLIKARMARQNKTIISGTTLKSLGKKIREERETQNHDSTRRKRKPTYKKLEDIKQPKQGEPIPVATKS